MKQGDKEPPIGIDKVRAGPTGQLTIEDKRNQINLLGVAQCDADRERLSRIDNDRFLRDIIDDANRGNASFYMIDPSGLTVRGADRSSGHADALGQYRWLCGIERQRSEWRIRTDRCRHVVVLPAWLLCCEHEARTDRFREITVRVRQPGVAPCGRGRGIAPRRQRRSPRRGTVRRSRRSLQGSRPCRVPSTSSGGFGRAPAFESMPSAGPGLDPRCGWWASSSRRARGPTNSVGARVRPSIGGASGSGQSTTGTATLKPGEVAFVTKLDAPASGAGAIDVRVRLTAAEGSALPLVESVRLDVAESKPVMYRRGPTTGPRMVPAASPVFSRRNACGSTSRRPGARRHAGDRRPPARPRWRGNADSRGRLERTDDGTGQRWVTAELSRRRAEPWGLRRRGGHCPGLGAGAHADADSCGEISGPTLLPAHLDERHALAREVERRLDAAVAADRDLAGRRQLTQFAGLLELGVLSGRWLLRRAHLEPGRVRCCGPRRCGSG